MARHRVSPLGLELVKRFEGLRRRAARTANGGWTLGYGHVRSAREGAVVDEADAEALLRFDLQPVERLLDAVVYTPLTQNQTDALMAFAYSVGADAFRGSDVLRRVNEGDLLAAAAALEGWRRAAFEGEVIVVDALIRRRAAEKALFLTPTDGFIPAPSGALRPQLDFGSAVVPAPAQPVAEVTTPLDGDTVAPERVPAGEADGPSPAQRAAAAVSRRLEALFPDEDLKPERAGAPPLELATDLAATPFAAVEEPAPHGLVEVIAQAPTAELIPPPALPRVVDPAGEFDRRIAKAEPEPETSEPAEAIGPYVILGVIGIALFIVGVLLIVQGRGAGETGLTGQQTLLGGLLGVIGIFSFCTGMYEVLRTVGRGADGGKT